MDCFGDLGVSWRIILDYLKGTGYEGVMGSSGWGWRSDIRGISR
jgi:hypothetical protein